MTYKHFDNLEMNFESIVKQRFTDYEVILSDDGSENFDESWIREIAQKIGISDKLIIRRQESNVGTVRNYGSAIESSHGEIIVPLSQDDVFSDEDVLGDLNEYFRQSKNEICFCRRQTFEGKTLPCDEDFQMLTNDPLDQILLRLTYRNLIYGATLYFYRKLWETAGGFQPENYRLLEDYPFSLKLLSKGIRIDTYDRVTILYGENGISNKSGQVSKTYLMLMKDHITLYNIFIDNYCKSLKNIGVRRAIKYHWETTFLCYKKPDKRIFLKIMACLKYPDIAFIHAVYKKCFVKLPEHHFAERIVKKEFK